MASMDDIRDMAGAAFEKAKPLVEGAVNAGAHAVEQAGEWIDKDHPNADKALDAVGSAATGAVNAMADGANVAYEFLKDRVEEISKKDVDGDGVIGKIKPEDIAAGAELAAEAVTDAVDKVAAKAADIPGDVAAGAELAAEAVSDAVDKAAAKAANIPGDLAAGAELAAEAVKQKIDEASE